MYIVVVPNEFKAPETIVGFSDDVNVIDDCVKAWKGRGVDTLVFESVNYESKIRCPASRIRNDNAIRKACGDCQWLVRSTADCRIPVERNTECHRHVWEPNYKKENEIKKTSISN
jgi:hypothetical protein